MIDNDCTQLYNVCLPLQQIVDDFDKDFMVLAAIETKHKLAKYCGRRDYVGRKLIDEDGRKCIDAFMENLNNR